MVIAYHAIFTTYGTWLPNDPRGSFSKAVYNEELSALAPILYGRQSPQPPANELRRFWATARPCLERLPYFITDATRGRVGSAFARVVKRLGLTLAACSIMKDHVHLVVMRSRYRIEYVVNQVKGAATHDLGLDLTPWARQGWNVFLDDAEAVAAAVEYVEANPPSAGLGLQHWDFVASWPEITALLQPYV